jgi:hypothetical protein
LSIWRQNGQRAVAMDTPQDDGGVLDKLLPGLFRCQILASTDQGRKGVC